MEESAGLEASFIEIGQVATELGASAWVWAGNFLAVIVLTLALFILALRRGGAGLISFNIALYGAYGLYTVFPYRDAIIGIGATPLVQAIISIFLFLAMAILPFVITVRLTSQSFGALSILQNLALALLAACFLIALSYHVFDLSNIYTFSEPLNQLFEPEGYFFYWFVAPLLGLYFIAR